METCALRIENVLDSTEILLNHDMFWSQQLCSVGLSLRLERVSYTKELRHFSSVAQITCYRVLYVLHGREEKLRIYEAGFKQAEPCIHFQETCAVVSTYPPVPPLPIDVAKTLLSGGLL